MIEFYGEDGEVLLVYTSVQGPATWIDTKFSEGKTVTIAKVFDVRLQDMVTTPQGAEPLWGGEDSRTFIIGTLEDGYVRIRRDVLCLKHDAFIAADMPLSKRTFVAERGISIFRAIDRLYDGPIVIGGDREGAVPEATFQELLASFPTTTELNYYAQSRVSRVLGEYLPTMTDAESRLASYMKKREKKRRHHKADPSRLGPAASLELEKFQFVRDRMREMLRDAESYSEREWQNTVASLFLLIFPQYIAVLRDVHVKEDYSRPDRSTARFIDLALITADGFVDILEIKKPFERALMSITQYRNNHVPLRELSGAIVQVEKYLFYLSKSGRSGELDIAKANADSLPPGLQVKIANPRGFVLAGRDENFSDEQQFDFQFVRRKYANVVDIISYDDLLRRIDNIITALQSNLARV